MSYILEALRRSQAERDQGRASVLDLAAPPVGEAAAAPHRRWAQFAAVLAATALLIALYVAMRPPAGSDADPEAAQGPGPATTPAEPRSAAVRSASAEPSAEPPAAPAPAPGRLPPPVRPEPAAAAAPVAGEAPVPTPPAPPLVEAPPPKGQPRGPSAADAEPRPSWQAQVRPSGKSEPAVAPPGGALTPEDEAAVALEEELARQAAADPELVQYMDGGELPQPPAVTGLTPVPPDLVAAIDAFKQEVRGGSGRTPARGTEKGANSENAARPAPSTHASVRPAAAAAPATDPTRLRLTRDQEAALPSFRLTVHVYDADPARRFVLINGLKYAEGSRTREGLTVETIREDGAVLVHEGHPFFVHR